MIDYLKNTIVFGNSLMNYAYFIGIIIISFIFAKIISHIFKKYFQKLALKTKTKLDDILALTLEKPLTYLVFFLGIFFAFKYLAISQSLDNILNKVFSVIIILIITIGLNKLVNSFIAVYWVPLASKTKSNVDDNLIPVIKTFSSIIIWSIALIFLLNNLGLNITSLVAGLGIGGIAIAFALQNILSDIFSSISIYLDKPFQVGDYVVTGIDSGTVKKIGLKSTRITTLQGEELVVSNKELTETRIRNYKKMKKRRAAFKIGVEYGTSSEKLKKIPLIIKKIVDKVEGVDFDRAHFTDFGDFSLNFDIVMFVATRDYAVYRDIQQKVNLEIVEAFEKEKIDMAFPTQTVYVKK